MEAATSGLTTANLAQWNATQVRLELPKGDSKTQLRSVAQEFESIFVKQMLDSMRATLNKDNDILNGGMAQDIFQDMLYQEYAGIIAHSGSIGLADLIVSQYSNTVGSSTNASRAAAVYDSVQAES